MFEKFNRAIDSWMEGAEQMAAAYTRVYVGKFDQYGDLEK